MVQRTFYAYDHDAPAEPLWEPRPDDVHTLRHGYNLADLDRLAKFSIRRVVGVTIAPQDRYQIAWSAIAEALYAADTRPEPSDLITAGQNAIARHRDSELHHRGVQQHTFMPAPRHAVYWETVVRATPGPEARIVDRATLWQIWPRLTAAERSAVHAYAAHGTHQAAADALGITYGAFAARLACARRRFLTFWHEGEQPSGLWRVELRSARGDGLPPEVARERLATFTELRKEGLTLKDIAARMGTSYRTAQRLAQLYRAERGL